MPRAETANLLVPGGTGGMSAPLSAMSVGPQPHMTMMSGILPDISEDYLIKYYRDCYYYDAVAGTCCDLSSTFPFSDWTLTGVDAKVAEIYTESLARLNMRSLLPEISLSYLVDADFIGTLVYDPKAGAFSDIMIHDRLNCTVTPSPLYSVDALITMHSNDKLRAFMNTGSPYLKQMLSNYPPRLIDSFLAGNVDLDPITTLHLPRRTLADHRGSVSYLKRVLPVYLLERLLWRGTLLEAGKRQRATTHVQVGDDTWEPTPAEIQQIMSLFQSSELDPLGAWVVTRNGVQVQDVRQGGDFWKWPDIVEQLVPIKLRSLGLSEAYLSSDANFSTGEAALSVFLENMDSYRQFITYKVFNSKLFPLIAVLKGLYKPGHQRRKTDSVKDLLFNLSNQKALDIPVIQWNKSLEGKDTSNQFEVLEALSAKGFPIPLKMWAAAAGVDVGALISDLDEDKAIQQRLAKYTGSSPNQQMGGEGGQEAEDLPDDYGGTEEASTRKLPKARDPYSKNPLASLPVRSGVQREASRRRPLLAREFDHSPVRISKSGKKVHAVVNEAQHTAKINQNIYRAFKNLQDPHVRATVRKNVIAKLGRMPNIIQE